MVMGQLKAAPKTPEPVRVMEVNMERDGDDLRPEFLPYYTSDYEAVANMLARLQQLQDKIADIDVKQKRDFRFYGSRGKKSVRETRRFNYMPSRG
ncbi:unnamed protein product [Bursaphelenchus okinawaensis]|uniref:Uncharacterized protein n=1 Tax=Bursaphelenchus okinawaensis TaxID=465554 RepID=A0A811LRE9_9BILA|nr:unnamed protein product [Bursaphelenchus okinawaensis]CAG9127632.1 unnamed protein product [Bursaphelenchus okinawaensis]